MTHGPLTMHDLIALETIGSVASASSRVRWLLDSGDIAEGTARSIGDERGNFLRSDEDIRDGYLRITSVQGFDYFLPVTDLMKMVHAGEFARD
jgi:hypothetical protein